MTTLGIPKIEEVRTRLEALGHAQVQALAVRSTVPFTTLWKIRSGETVDPQLSTVSKLWPLIRTARKAKA